MSEEELKQMDKEQLLGVIKAQQFEIEILNNIINELEKWLEERSGDVSFAYHHTLNKLQELKHKKIYGSVDSEIVYFDELGSDK